VRIARTLPPYELPLSLPSRKARKSAHHGSHRARGPAPRGFGAGPAGERRRWGEAM